MIEDQAVMPQGGNFNKGQRAGMNKTCSDKSNKYMAKTHGCVLDIHINLNRFTQNKVYICH